MTVFRYDIAPPSSNWILPMFSRPPILFRDLNIGHCFETLVVGHVIGANSYWHAALAMQCAQSLVECAAAYGDSPFHALRGAVAQKFREYYGRAIMCESGRSDHGMAMVCAKSEPLFKGRQHAAHIINLYQKVGGLNGPVWPHLCR